MTGPSLSEPLWPHAEGRHVYFIQGVDGGPIKIGSGNEPEKRLRQFQPGSPVRLRLLGVIWDAGAWTERELHREFAKDRSHGEWFHSSPRLLAYINEHAGNVVRPLERPKGGVVDGRKLAVLRREARLSQAHLAHRAGLDIATISDLELDRPTNPKLHTLLALARALHCRAVDFAPELAEVPDSEQEVAG
jgi:DNA-binding XRE family transcriptional regulator